MEIQLHNHNELLQAVLSHPESDDHRLLYARWQELYGDPERAELIRVQIAIANALASDDDQLTDLESRERALLTIHGRQWLGYNFGHSGDWEAIFRRGFVESLTLNGPWSIPFDAISACHPVQSLTLLGSGTASELSLMASDLADCKGLALVSTLRDFTHIEEETTKSKSLAHVTDSYWKREGVVLSKVLSSTYLPEQMHLHTNDAWCDYYRKELLRHPKLSCASGLVLRSNCRDGVIFKWLQKCKNLRELTLFVEINEWCNACTKGLIESDVWANIRKFGYVAGFSYWYGTKTFEFPWFDALSKSKLQELTISNGNYMETATDVSSIWDAFAKLSPLENLKRLGMYQVPYEFESLKRFFQNGHASQLEELRFHLEGRGLGSSGPHISSEVFLDAPAAPYLKTLGMNLYIGWDVNQSKYAKQLSECPMLKSVRHLDLSGGSISLECMKALVAWGFFKNIRTLVFPSCDARRWSVELVNDYLDLMATSDGFQNLHSLRLPDELILSEENLDSLQRLLESPRLSKLTAVRLNLGSLEMSSRETLMEIVEERDRPLWLCGLTQHPTSRQGMSMRLFDIESIASQPVRILDTNWGELDQFLNLWQTGYGL